MSIVLRKPMPYSRDALTLIRSGASAVDLGWNAEFYHRICRRHELREISSPAPPDQTAVKSPLSGYDKSKLDLEAVRDLTAYLPFKPWSHAERRIITFDYHHGEQAIRYSREVGRNMACLLIMMARAENNVVPSTELTAAIGGNPRSGKTQLSIAVRALRTALIRSRLDMLGKRGAGYCLVCIGSDNPARISIISLGEERFADIEKMAQHE